MCLIAGEEGGEDGGGGGDGGGRDGGVGVGGRGRRPSPGDRYTAEYYRLRLQDPIHEKCNLTLVQVLFALLSNKRSGQVKDGPSLMNCGSSIISFSHQTTYFHQLCIWQKWPSTAS